MFDANVRIEAEIDSSDVAPAAVNFHIAKVTAKFAAANRYHAAPGFCRDSRLVAGRVEMWLCRRNATQQMYGASGWRWSLNAAFYDELRDAFSARRRRPR